MQGPITGLPLHERARLGLGYLPQERSVFTKLSVRDNIAAILEERGCGRRAARKGADERLAQFGLVHVTQERASRLSGGEQRRLEIARSLAIKPRFLLFDEPFADIDPLTVEALHGILVALRASGVGVLLTDHNVQETLTLCDRAYVLFAGRVLAEGPPERPPRQCRDAPALPRRLVRARSRSHRAVSARDRRYARGALDRSYSSENGG